MSTRLGLLFFREFSAKILVQLELAFVFAEMNNPRSNIKLTSLFTMKHMSNNKSPSYANNLNTLLPNYAKYILSQNIDWALIPDRW